MKALKTAARTIAAVAAAVMLIWFILPMVTARVINIGNMTGVGLCLWVLVMAVAPVHRAVKRLFCRRKPTRILYRAVNALVIAFLVYGACCTAAIAATGLTSPAVNATAVVLGAQVVGTRPSQILAGRIAAAETYLKENPGAKAVLTGGKGSDEQISEADCMFNELTARGIAADRLFREDRATDTAENFRYSRRIIEKEHLDHSIAVITDGFHQLRAHLIAQKQGFGEQIGSVCAKTRLRYVPTYVVREWLAMPTVIFK